MPRKTSRKPHVTDALATIDAAIVRATQIITFARSNSDLHQACMFGRSDLIRAKRFLENLSDWGKL